jgi:hypothetical protein
MRNDQGDTQGISNRETFVEEQQERMEFPPVRPDTPPIEQDAGGDEGERDPANNENRQTSHKAGSRSIAQKEAESKYADRSHPSTHKVAGAEGREQGDHSHDPAITRDSKSGDY